MNRQHMLAGALFWMLVTGCSLVRAGETTTPQTGGDRADAATEAPAGAADAASQAEKRAVEELARQLEAWKGVRGEVQRALESHKEDVRLAALDALEGIDHPGAASQLKACVLEDRSPYVAEKAAELLGLCRSDAVMEYVTTSLKRKEEGCAPQILSNEVATRKKTISRKTTSIRGVILRMSLSDSFRGITLILPPSPQKDPPETSAERSPSVPISFLPDGPGNTGKWPGMEWRPGGRRRS